MSSRVAISIAAASIALLALTACTTPAPPVESSPPIESSAPTFGLATADTALGTIIVDEDGNTVYQFDKDTQGGDASACAGDCAPKWPAVPGDLEVELDGVSGELGVITGTNGEPQLTLNGWPLYYFAGDAAAGETNGQGVNEVWWVLTPSGEPIKG
jgi:predicted lipoprotein with Yx(FWY)xxD motif